MVRIRRTGQQTDEVPGAVVRPSGERATLAWCLEVVRQVNGFHDAQVMGGAVLHLGMIAEMRTGEGKTLAVTLPAYLGALSGQPVHVVTANDYLTARDRDWMRPVYQFLGLSAGLLDTAPNPDRTARRAEYAADVVYGQWDQFGCDMIRDNLAWDPGEQVQRGLGLAIVDEADLILIDQMRHSALVSGSASEPAEGHQAAAEAVRGLRPGEHFTADRAAMTASLTDDGVTAVEDWFGIENLYDEAHGGLAHIVENAVKASALYQRDRDYLVSGEQIVIIDRVSGRPLKSRYSDGMHEALEAKEDLPVRPATQVIGTMLCRDYLRQYERLAGLTGTAASEAPVYRELYGLEVVTVPTGRPVITVDHADKLYRKRQAKLAAIASDAGKRAASGQPVLVGAMSDADADAVAELLGEAGISCELLSARNFDREAAVLADAGRPGAVTIVVKMAGRGVDIVLGGRSGTEREAVVDLGGLCVLGTERNSDRRTELHLRGRAGRQGDPGESLFYLSAEDEVVGQILKYTPKSMVLDGTTLGRLSRDLDKAQFRSAASRAQWYQTYAAFDDVLAQQQRVIYAERNAIVHQQDLRVHVAAVLDDVLAAEVRTALRAGSDALSLVARLTRLYPVAGASSIDSAMRRGGKDSAAGVLAASRRDIRQAYENREAQLGRDIMRKLERAALLSATDEAWREHLAAMSDLLSSAMIRAAGGAPSLPDYQREAAALYTGMTDQVRRTAVNQIFYAKIKLRPSGS